MSGACSTWSYCTSDSVNIVTKLRQSIEQHVWILSAQQAACILHHQVWLECHVIMSSVTESENLKTQQIEITEAKVKESSRIYRLIKLGNCNRREWPKCSRLCKHNVSFVTHVMESAYFIRMHTQNFSALILLFGWQQSIHPVEKLLQQSWQVFPGAGYNMD